LATFAIASAEKSNAGSTVNVIAKKKRRTRHSFELDDTLLAANASPG
jgi:hypothetical protein